MLIELKLRLTSPCLGQQHTGKSAGAGGTAVQIRRFRKINSNQILIDIPQWQWALKEAADALLLSDIDVACIRTEEGFDAPTLHLYSRRWTDKKKAHQECFEAIREGTVLTIPIYVASPEPGSNKRAPTVPEVASMFTFVGKWLGISPWGGKFGYGRFTVDACEKTA